MAKLTQEQVTLAVFRVLQEQAYQTAKEKGFHDAPSNFGERLALIHEEVSELMSAYRKGALHAQCDKATIPRITNFQEEIGDIIIRCLNLAEEHGVDAGEGVVAKMAYNKTRPHKHGKVC